MRERKRNKKGESATRPSPPPLLLSPTSRREPEIQQTTERSKDCQLTVKESLPALPPEVPLADQLLERPHLLDLLGVDLSRRDALFAPAARDVRQGIEADELVVATEVKRGTGRESEYGIRLAESRRDRTHVRKLERT